MERISDLLSPQTLELEAPLTNSSPLSTQSPSLVSFKTKTVALSLENQKDSEAIWNAVLERVSVGLDKQIFSAWIKPLVVDSISIETTGNAPSLESSKVVVVLSAPNKFCCEHVERHYSTLLCSAINDQMHTSDCSLIFKVNPLIKRSTPDHQTKESKTENTSKSRQIIAVDDSQEARPQRARTLPQSNLNPKYSFSNYVIGQCNQFTHAVALRICENIGHQYNPFFIYGGVGLGKTHLANAIGNSVARRGKKVLFVSSELFVSELISAIRSDRMSQFRTKFRSLDLLIIDDVQFLSGKERTQEEFFHTFNELHQRHKQIILTSDKVPHELIGLEERLRTRFASGISADLQVPDFETRVAIISKKVEDSRAVIPQDIIRYVAEKIQTNVRELEGALNRLLAFSSLHDAPLTLEVTKDILASLTPEKTREITVDSIQKVVTERFSVSLNDLLGKRRTHNIAFARQVAMFLCRKLTGRSFPEVGALFGGRDHSTVIHACRVIDGKISEDEKFKEDVGNLEKKIRQVV